MSDDHKDQHLGEEGELAEPEIDKTSPAAPAGEMTTGAEEHSSRPRAWLWLILALMIIVVVVVGIWLLRSGSGATPRVILGSMLATYQSAQSYQAEGTLEVATKMPQRGTDDQVEMPFKMAYQAPNLFYHEYQEGGVSVSTVACDGQDLYMAMGFSKKVARGPAPQDLAALNQVPGLNRGFNWGDPEGGLMQLLDANSLLLGKFNWANVKAVRAGFDQQNTWLGSLAQPEDTWPLTVTSRQDIDLVLWVDKQSHLLRQAAVDMTGEQLLAQLPEELTDAQRREIAEAFKDMTLRILLSHRSVSVGQPIPPETFQYQPKPDTEIVEVDSPNDLFAALTGREMKMPESKHLEGQAPIDFTAQDLEGNPVKLSDFQGKPIILDFWATWCAPCLKEMPILEELYRKLKSQGLEVIALSNDRKIETVRSYLQEHPASFTVLWMEPQSAASAKVSEEYGITGIPRTLYIGSDWVVKVDTEGLHPKKDMVECVRKLGIDTSAVK